LRNRRTNRQAATQKRRIDSKGISSAGQMNLADPSARHKTMAAASKILPMVSAFMGYS
jgi:hypothetical protein